MVTFSEKEKIDLLLLSFCYHSVNILKLNKMSYAETHLESANKAYVATFGSKVSSSSNH